MVKKEKVESLQDLADKYLAGPGAELKSCDEMKRVLVRYVLPRLGSVRVWDVEYDHASMLMRRMKDRPVQANRALAALSVLMTWAVRWKLRADNPCRWVKRYPEQRRRRYLSVAEQQAVERALDACSDGEGAAFLRLLLLTGARVSELARAQWRDWREREGVLVVGDGKNGDERVIHLSARAAAVLEGLRPVEARVGRIFRGGIDKATARLWCAVRVDAGCPDVRRHDLRHSFASAGLAAGLSLEQIGEMLGHRSAASTKRYSHLRRDVGRGLVERVDSAIGGDQ